MMIRLIGFVLVMEGEVFGVFGLSGLRAGSFRDARCDGAFSIGPGVSMLGVLSGFFGGCLVGLDSSVWSGFRSGCPVLSGDGFWLGPVLSVFCVSGRFGVRFCLDRGLLFFSAFVFSARLLECLLLLLRCRFRPGFAFSERPCSFWLRLFSLWFFFRRLFSRGPSFMVCRHGPWRAGAAPASMPASPSRRRDGFTRGLPVWCGPGGRRPCPRSLRRFGRAGRIRPTRP